MFGELFEFKKLLAGVVASISHLKGMLLALLLCDGPELGILFVLFKSLPELYDPLAVNFIERMVFLHFPGHQIAIEELGVRRVASLPVRRQLSSYAFLNQLQHVVFLG